MKRFTGFLSLALAGTALVMLAADTAFAQRGGRGGRGGGRDGWGWGPGGYGYHGSSGSWRGGWTPQSGFYAYPRGYGYGSYDGYYGRGYSDSYYGRGYYDGYYGSGYYPRYSGYYGYGYSSPGYYGSGYGSGSYAPTYGPSYGYAQGAMPSYQQAPMGQDNTVARIQVKLPDENAEVWFDGQKTRQMGATRSFTTPPLDGNYQYQVSAAWHQDGRLVTQERTVHVKPGANVNVDFTQGATTPTGTQGTTPPPRTQGTTPPPGTQGTPPPAATQRPTPPRSTQDAQPDRVDDRIPLKRNPEPDRRNP